ncbi:MAG: HAD-IA family hydrolase [Polyangiaceae bacterium]|nr:HAD-IA family hydrolase [Polyangiaceae bacterium]
MKLGHPFSHVIFDLDGVLLDTERLYTAATQTVLAPYGKRYGWDVKLDLMGRAEHESANLLVERLDLPLTPEEYIAARAIELERLVAKCEPVEGAPELVALLGQLGVPLAVATSSSRRWFERKTSRHGWFADFAVVVCGDDPDVPWLKPDPTIYLVTARRLGVPAERCVVFEDSPAGVQAAVAAGMQVVALVDPSLRLEMVPGADLYLRGYDELRPEDLGL